MCVLSGIVHMGLSLLIRSITGSSRRHKQHREFGLGFLCILTVFVIGSRALSSVVVHRSRYWRWIQGIHVLLLGLEQDEIETESWILTWGDAHSVVSVYRNRWAGNHRLSWESFKQAAAADNPVLQNSLWKGKYILRTQERRKKSLLPFSGSQKT